MNAYERIVNACCGDVEQAELIAQQIARVTVPTLPERQASSSAGPASAVAGSPPGLEAALLAAIAHVFEEWA